MNDYKNREGCGRVSILLFLKYFEEQKDRTLCYSFFETTELFRDSNNRLYSPFPEENYKLRRAKLLDELCDQVHKHLNNFTS